MTSSTEDQAKIGQLKDLEFEMSWKTRDEIMRNLNLHTKLFSGLIIKADAREKMLKANNELMTTLMNLPPKIDGRSKSIESLERSPDDMGMNEVVLDLSLNMKSRIVDTLIANHHVVLLLDADSSSSVTNAKMIGQNNDLICELLKLRSRTVSKGDHHIDQAAKASGSQRPIEQPSDKGSAIGGLDKNVRGSKRKLDESEEELEKPIRIGSDVGRNEITFTWKLKGVNALLAGRWRMPEVSSIFICGGRTWFLTARRFVEDNVDYLSVFLHYNYIPNKGRWSIEGTFELRLLSSDPAGGDLIRTMNDKVFKNPGPPTDHGWRTFITMDKLRSGSFIQDDKIKIRVHLTTNNFKIF